MAKVVVIGRNYTSRLGMIRALGQAGHKVFVIKTNGDKPDVDAKSKYVTGYLSAKEPDRKLLIQTIIKLADEEKVVLMPVDDYAASVIDEHIEQLKKQFVFQNINMQAGAINHLMDKGLQKKDARKFHLNVAEGWYVEVKDGDYKLPKNISYPCFPKPQISFKGNKECMKKCSSEQELKEVLDEIARQRDCPILIEQYITFDKEYAILGYSSDNQIVMPYMIILLEQGHGAHRGVTMLGKLLPTALFEQTLEKTKNFIQSLHYTGLFDVDFYESNGVIYFNELNLRFGASGYAITKQGINLPNLLVQKLLGKEEAVVYPSDAPNPVFVNEKVCYEDYLAGYIDGNEKKKIVSLASFGFIKDENDKGPWIAFLWIQCKHYIKKSLLKFWLR